MTHEVVLPQIVRRVATAADVAERGCDVCGEPFTDPTEAVWVCWTPTTRSRELRHVDWRTCVLLARTKALIARRAGGAGGVEDAVQEEVG